MLSGIFLRRNLVDDHLVLWCVSDQVLSPSRASAVRYLLRHSPAMRTIACRLRSTSASVVAHEDTLILMAVSPCQTVPPHQQVPSSWTRRITSRVTSGRPKDTNTWLITTSFSTSKPAPRSPRANRCAWAHVRSISAHSPDLPSDFSAAHNSTPRARLDASGVWCIGSRREPGSRYAAVIPIDARSAVPSLTMAKPLS